MSIICQVVGQFSQNISTFSIKLLCQNMFKKTLSLPNNGPVSNPQRLSHLSSNMGITGLRSSVAKGPGAFVELEPFHLRVGDLSCHDTCHAGYTTHHHILPLCRRPHLYATRQPAWTSCEVEPPAVGRGCLRFLVLNLAPPSSPGMAVRRIKTRSGFGTRGK